MSFLNGKHKSYIWEIKKGKVHHYWNISLTYFKVIFHVTGIKKTNKQKNPPNPQKKPNYEAAFSDC